MPSAGPLFGVFLHELGYALFDVLDVPLFGGEEQAADQVWAHIMLQQLRAVSALLDSKAPADATAFKNWLRDIAQKTAEAANEGGFLGSGGVPVSEAETATLAEIATALNVRS